MDELKAMVKGLKDEVEKTLDRENVEMVHTTSVDYRLGRIDAKLEGNDAAHTLILEELKGIKGKLDTVFVDSSTLKAKTSIYGAVGGVIVSALIFVANMIWGHVAK